MPSFLPSLKQRLALAGYPIVRLGVRHLPTIAARKKLILLSHRMLFWRKCTKIFSSRYGQKFEGDLTDLITRQIYLQGEWEACLTRFLQERLKPGDVFIDVGANIGYFSMLAASLVTDAGSVVAVEASPSVFAQLTRNIELNAARNVRAVNFAASDKPGELQLFSSDENAGATTSSKGRLAEREFKYLTTVRAVPLAEILTTREIESARVVKIDVEGAEYDVTTGLLGALEKTRKDLEIVVEVSPTSLLSEQRSAAEFIDRFTSRGFFPYVLPNGYTVEEMLQVPADCRPVRLRSNLEEQTDIVFSRQDAETL